VAVPNESVVRRFYEELWNEWRLDLIEVIASPQLHFRGSFGSTHIGHEDFMRYAESVRAAYPNWHNRIDALFALDDRVLARLTWSGTRLSRIDEDEPTGVRVEHCGVALFRLSAGTIEEALVVRDDRESWPERSEPGEMESQILELGEMVCVRYRIPAGFDSAPLYRGLPDDMCPCEHWCYLVRGALRYRFSDGDTTDVRAGDAFHLKAGHLADVLEDAELIEFTRTEDYRRKAAHLASSQVTGEP
jgi:predicted ester cyclase